MRAEPEAAARKAAGKRRISVSRWIAGQITGNLSSTWPAPVLKAFGAFAEFPEAKELRRGYGKDAPREPID